MTSVFFHPHGHRSYVLVLVSPTFVFHQTKSECSVDLPFVTEGQSSVTAQRPLSFAPTEDALGPNRDHERHGGSSQRLRETPGNASNGQGFHESKCESANYVSRQVSGRRPLRWYPSILREDGTPEQFLVSPARHERKTPVSHNDFDLFEVLGTLRSDENGDLVRQMVGFLF